LRSHESVNFLCRVARLPDICCECTRPDSMASDARNRHGCVVRGLQPQTAPADRVLAVSAEQCFMDRLGRACACLCAAHSPTVSGCDEHPRQKEEHLAAGLRGSPSPSRDIIQLCNHIAIRAASNRAMPSRIRAIVPRTAEPDPIRHWRRKSPLRDSREPARIPRWACGTSRRTHALPVAVRK
jgi:hypothetical protein